MEPELRAELDQLFGAINAQKFAIESLWAYLIDKDGGSKADGEATKHEMLRQFEDLPPRFVGADPARVLPVLQYAVEHLEGIWGNVIARLPDRE